MSILLPFDDYIGRDAFVAHSFRVGLMIFAGEIDLVSNVGRRKAAVAFYLSRMHTFAFKLLLLEIIIE